MKVLVVLVALGVAACSASPVPDPQASTDVQNYISYLKRVGREPNTYLVLEGGEGDTFKIPAAYGMAVTVIGKRIRVSDLDDPVKVNKLLNYARQPGYRINVRKVAAGAPAPVLAPNPGSSSNSASPAISQTA